MVKNERWGNPYIDTRDWSTYNDRLVRRGEFYLSFDLLDKWDDVLSTMNNCKPVRPFDYPITFIEWMARIHLCLHMPYRQMEGFVRKLSEYIPRLRAADYTTLFRRIQKLNLSLSTPDLLNSDPVVIAVDSTGIKVTNRGEWMREKWKIRRGWIKVHVMIDVKTNQILGLEITDEESQDEEMFLPLLNQAEVMCGEGRIEKALGDGAYDRKELFNELEKRGIQSGIKMRKTATKSRGSPYRSECVRRRNKIGYKKWAEETRYGMRWKGFIRA